MLTELKEYLDLNKINEATFLELKNTDIIDFLKGETEEDKNNAYSDFLTKFVFALITNALDLEKVIAKEEEGLLKGFTKNEFIVATALLWNVAYFIDGDGKLFKGFIGWITDVLKKNLEADETEDINDKINNLTVIEVCSSFYYIKPSLQNELVLRLYQIIGEKYLEDIEKEIEKGE